VRGRLATTRTVTGVVVGLITAGIAGAAAAPVAAAYTPPAAQYGVDEIVNYPFTASDGTELMGSVYYPTDLQTGARAAGTFPVLVDMTPYGMWDGNSTVPKDGSDDAILRYFTAHGYIGVELDARGTGRSGGSYTFEDPQQMRDDVEVINFVAHRLDGSNGVVGLAGMSYRGINQPLVGALLRPGTPVKAIAPASAGAIMYGPPFFMGGIPGAFWYAYPGIEQWSEVPPVDQLTATNGIDPGDLLGVGAGRVPTEAYHAEVYANTTSGGYMAHRDQWWQAREELGGVKAIVRAGIPALQTSGSNDFFSGGSLQLYAAFQDAAHRRSLYAPMNPRVKPDPRYQMVWGDTYSDGDYAYYLGYELQWYDHWLKHIDNGVGVQTTTLHIQETGGKNQWVDVRNGAYPITRHYTPYYLDAANALSASAPAGTGSDSLSYGPNQSLTYTSAPFSAGATLAGPVDATLFATSTTADAQFVATLNDVAPDGTATTVVPFAEVDGALDGANRAVDRSRSWTDTAGRLILPYHPYTTPSLRAVTPGAVTRYDIEMQPRIWSVQPGHRLQLVLTSQNADLVPTEPQLSALAGASFGIARGGHDASYLDLPLLPLNAFAPAPGDPSTVGLAG
jgi:hypothetical protein